MIDRAGLADFLRRRREALQPEDVGLPRGARRRTPGLRREEVAALSHMSTDFYSRLERERGPQPSEQMVASIAQGLHLSLDERDHLFRLAGHHPPVREAAGDHVGPGMLRIFDRLADTAAEIVTELGETLRQTPLSAALVGDNTRWTARPAASATAGSPTRPPGSCTRRRTTSTTHGCTPPGCEACSPSGVPGPARRTWPTCWRAGARSSGTGGPRTRSGSGQRRSSATSTPQRGSSS